MAIDTTDSVLETESRSAGACTCQAVDKGSEYEMLKQVQHAIWIKGFLHIEAFFVYFGGGIV